jgi:bifunctional DNA-binding transcriptional regulator/antitoxin component of YhaV-PrlF toxin-antitoxin module
MAGASTLSPKYKVSIPMDVCEHMGWRPGQKIAFFVKPGAYWWSRSRSERSWPGWRAARIWRDIAIGRIVSDALP